LFVIVPTIKQLKNACQTANSCQYYTTQELKNTSTVVLHPCNMLLWLVCRSY